MPTSDKTHKTKESLNNLYHQFFSIITKEHEMEIYSRAKWFDGSFEDWRNDFDVIPLEEYINNELDYIKADTTAFSDMCRHARGLLEIIEELVWDYDLDDNMNYYLPFKVFAELGIAGMSKSLALEEHDNES